MGSPTAVRTPSILPTGTRFRISSTVSDFTHSFASADSKSCRSGLHLYLRSRLNRHGKFLRIPISLLIAIARRQFLLITMAIVLSARFLIFLPPPLVLYLHGGFRRLRQLRS